MTRGGTAPDTLFRSILPSVARTASGNTSPFPSVKTVISTSVNVTAVSGTDPTLDIIIEHSFDKLTWSVYSPQQFDQIIAPGFQAHNFNTVLKYFRFAWTIGGTATPTFTFTLDSREFNGPFQGSIIQGPATLTDTTITPILVNSSEASTILLRSISISNPNTNQDNTVALLFDDAEFYNGIYVRRDSTITETFGDGLDLPTGTDLRLQAQVDPTLDLTAVASGIIF